MTQTPKVIYPTFGVLLLHSPFLAFALQNVINVLHLQHENYDKKYRIR